MEEITIKDFNSKFIINETKLFLDVLLFSTIDIILNYISEKHDL